MDKLNDLYDKKYKLLDELKEIEEKINVLEKQRISKCNHKWVTEKEVGIYGDKFTYCEICRINRYYNI